MHQVKITPEGSTFTLSCPPSDKILTHAIAFGGRWSSTTEVWTFEARYLKLVRHACRTIFGTDGITPPKELMSLRVTFAAAKDTYNQACFVAGRQVVRICAQAKEIQLGEGVTVVEGGFELVGNGKNSKLRVKGGTVLNVRDVPAGASLTADFGGLITIMNRRAGNQEALKTEREELVTRVTEIDILLGDTDAMV